MSLRLNPRWQAQIEADPAFQLGLRAKAEIARGIAERNVHRIMPRQAQAIEVQHQGHKVYLVNTDHGGHLDEWGSVKNPPNAPLRRAIRSVGLRLSEI